MLLTQFRALSFDCYGTLIDWESGLLQALAPLASRARPRLLRDQILSAYARHEHQRQTAAPGALYRDILEMAFTSLAQEWAAPFDAAECQAFGLSIRNWPAFPDSAAALRYLGEHYRLIVLSNVDNASFQWSRQALGIDFDLVLTAQDIGSYKPDDRNFRHLADKAADLGVAHGELLHVSQSVFHDLVPARRRGLATCWITRRGQDGAASSMTGHPEGLEIDFQFASLGDLAEAHRREIGAP